MSSVVGIDLSTFEIDLVKLDETTHSATWTRCTLEGGATAWDRLFHLREALPPQSWWNDVYLVAIEAPHGRGEPGTQAKLNQVVGAIVACLPAALRDPHRCWLVGPHEWKAGLGLKGKPSWDDLARVARLYELAPQPPASDDPAAWQNARDAYCLALWARDTNAKGVAAA